MRRDTPKSRDWADRRHRLPARSDRRIAEAPDRANIAAAARARDGNRCMAEVLVPSVACSGPLDAHERIPRSAWKGGYLVLANVITICRSHHDWVGDYPIAAHDLGLHGYSWERDR